MYPINTEEETIMGKHTMHDNDELIHTMTDDVRDNRDLLVQYCTTHDLRVANTMYRKPIHNTATYRKEKRE